MYLSPGGLRGSEGKAYLLQTQLSGRSAFLLVNRLSREPTRDDGRHLYEFRYSTLPIYRGRRAGRRQFLDALPTVLLAV